MDAKVSVIIPVYNADKYLAACIESLVGQTLRECEFILINDGSNDNSRHIIESYQSLDSRIKLINQENQGVSMARNKGLKLAKGEYIGFVDADDYIEKDMLETLYHAAKADEYDIIISDFECEVDGHKYTTRYPFPPDCTLSRDYIEQELLPYFLKTDNLNPVWNKLYKNKIIRKYNIDFPKGVALGEDGMFNMLFFSHAVTMKYIDYTGYHYREVAGSATRDIVGKDYFRRAIEVYTLEWAESYLRKIDKEKIRLLKSTKLINNVMSYIHIYFTPTEDISFSKRFQYVKNMIRNKYVRESLQLYCRENYDTLGRYEKFVINLMKKKFTLGLYCAASYSRMRNS